jgi:hypothetical protein
MQVAGSEARDEVLWRSLLISVQLNRQFQYGSGSFERWRVNELGICERKPNLVESYRVEYFQILPHANEIGWIVEIQESPSIQGSLIKRTTPMRHCATR